MVGSNQRLKMYLKIIKRKFKSNDYIRLFSHYKRKFLNVEVKYIVWLIIALVIAWYFLFPKEGIIFNNETLFLTYGGLKFKDHSVLISVIIGISTFFATLFGVNMSFKSTKLSSLPDNAVDLLIDLEFQFNEYEIDKQNDQYDIIAFFIEILKYWKNHQKAIRLLCPKFYKKFLKFYSKPIKLCLVLPTN